MAAPGGLPEFARGGRARTGLALAIAIAAVILIVRAELTPPGTSTRSGVVGYFLLQVAGILALLGREDRRWARWAWLLGVLLASNLVLHLLLQSGVMGPRVVLISIHLVAVFISGVLGAAAVISALTPTGGGPRRTPIVPAVAVLIVAALLAGAAIGGDGNVPPPPTPGGPRPTSVATLPATPTPAQRFPLVISVVGGGTVLSRTPLLRCADSCTFDLPAGTVVSLTPQPAPTTVFGGWEGCAIRCEVRMDAERRVTATFRLPLVRVSLDGKARGSVRSEPRGILCPPTCEAPFERGTSVSLAPSPDRAAIFAGWTDACAGFDACVLDVPNDIETTAWFAAPAQQGYEAISCTDAGRIQVRRGGSVSSVACYQNTGTVTWTRGGATEVELAQCCPLGSSSPFGEWVVGTPSKTVYADLTPSSVGPGQTARAVLNLRIPDSAPLGDHRLDGYLVVATTGAPVVGGAFSLVVTVIR